MNFRLSFFSILLIAFSVSAIAQQFKWTLTGTVVDKSNYDPIPNVNIYISNTTIGTTSDIDGKFRISGIPFETISIVFSCIGFEPETRHVIFKGNRTIDLRIRMDQTAYDLPPIDVVEKENEEWQRNYKLFKEVFLGERKNTGYSKIVNPYRINFSRSFNSTLTASCPEPLVIINDFLGYKITYSLDEFVYKNPNVKFFGTVFFEENLSEDPDTAVQQKQNRLMSYAGSVRHLLKTISRTYNDSQTGLTDTDTLDEDLKLERNIEAMSRQGFIVSIVNQLPKRLDKPSTAYHINTDLLINPGISSNELVLRFSGFLRIDFEPDLIDPAYNLESDIQHSWFTLDNREAYIDLTSWSIDEYTIKTYGDWANKRVLDMLPLDYKPETVPDVVNIIY